MRIIERLGEHSYSIRGIALGCALILLFGSAVSGLLSLTAGRKSAELSAGENIIDDIYTRFVYSDYAEIWELAGVDDRMPEGLENLFIGPEETWLPALLSHTLQAEPIQGTRFALGLWHRRNQEITEALTLFHAENASYPHTLVRSVELETALRHADPESVERLISNPEYLEEVDSSFQLEWGRQQGDWGKVLRHLVNAQIEGVTAMPLLLTLTGGIIWMLLLFSLFPGAPPARLWLQGFLALGLGVISTWLTVLSGMWMDTRFGLSPGSDFFTTLFYMIVSVGFREELCKLLLFSPLLVFTCRKGKDLEALLLGALVGLGFAVEENISYVMTNQSGVAVSRFVSANMLHFMLTGATALALTRAVRDPKRWGIDALQVLVFAVLLHGGYNTLLSQPVPGLGDMSTFHGAALVGCATLFFREVEQLAPLRMRTVSRTGLFCWGLCLLFCLELTLAAVQFRFDEALHLTGQAALASVFTGYIFVHFIREPLHS